ncbi:cytochrome b [Mesorhizobium sp. ORM6]
MTKARKEKIGRYSTAMIAIHWATAALIVAAWFTAEGGKRVQENPSLLHFSLGLAVLALIVPRMILRIVGQAPPALEEHRPWLATAAKIGHALLYAFLIGLPLSGWYAASRLSVFVSFFGIGLPAIATPTQGAPGLIAEIHENAGTVILYLAGLHALMAGWHHFVLRDSTLSRMSPL